MGLTTAKVRFTNQADPGRSIETKLLVDTGSTLSWVSEATLRKVGIEPRREKEFRTIEGRRVARRTGPALVRLGEAEADVEVVFAQRDDAEVLGVTTLESLGYEVDPVTQVLKPVSLLAM